MKFASGSIEEWDPDSSWNMLDWSDLEAAEMAEALALSNRTTISDSASGVTSQEAERGWAGVSGKLYLPFLRRLQSRLETVGSNRCIVYALGYDWRKPTTKTGGSDLASRILEIQQRDNIQQFILVTHSMGGIVARTLVKNRKNIRKLVIGAVHLAQPVDGAVVAYRRFLTGAVKSDGWEDVDGMIRYLLGETPDEVAEILSVIPAALELLPSHKYQRAINDPHWLFVSKPGSEEHPPTVQVRWSNVYEAYRSEKWPPSAVPTTVENDVQDRLRSALKSAGERVGQLGRYCHPATFSVFSSGLTTDVRVVAVGDGVNPPKVLFEEGRLPEGDGTVPESSAASLFPTQASTVLRDPNKDLVRQYKVEGVLHERICLDSNVQEFVESIIRDLLTPPTLFEHGEITGDGATVIRKRLEAVTQKNTEAELRVAKYLRQRGHEVHLIADDTSTQGKPVPDMHVDHAFNVEVKRPIDMAGPNAEALIAHAAAQVGPGGTVYVVHSSNAQQTLADFQQYAATYAQSQNVAASGISVVVIEERVLPVLGVW